MFTHDLSTFSVILARLASLNHEIVFFVWRYEKNI
jgi:hypothetical protein